MQKIERYLSEKLENRKTEGNFRQLNTFHNYIDFTSNDYIGLARNPLFHKEVAREIKEHHFQSIGATGSRLLSGNNHYVSLIEEEIAQCHESKACLIFNSGFDANYGLLAAVPSKNHLIIMDELVHASIHDGAKASKADKLFFRHNNTEHLAFLLSEAKEEHLFVIIESVYSMNGDLADLNAILKVCEKYHANLIVDEAHATGVVGEKGVGLSQHLNLHKKIFARIVTFGKGLGTQGACVLGSANLKSYLVNHCRSFIFSTGLSNHTLASIRMAYKLFPTMEEERGKLASNIAYFKSKLLNAKCIFIPSDTHIQSILFVGNQAVIAVANHLLDHKIDARPIRFPTVAKGGERIRICIHSYNTEEEINTLFQNIKQ